jgi:predicted porin
MKKSLLALAVLGAFAGAASAQSSVTLFGIVDVSVANISNKNAAGVKTTVQQERTDGINSSRLGFRGVEDLGGGLKAGFWIEGALQPDTGNAGGQTWQRRSTVSLMGGFGEVRLGRDYTPSFWNLTVFDPFGTNGVGSLLNVLNSPATGATPLNSGATTLVRANNTVGYFLPSGIGGLYGQAQVAAGEGADGNKYAGGRIGYAAGPVDVAVAYGQTGKTDKFKMFNVGGAFTFGPAKITGQYVQDKFLSVKQTTYQLGTVVTMGQGELHAAYTHANMEGGAAGTMLASNADANQIALGYVYNLSKRTALYGTGARIKNKGAAPYIVGGSAGTATGGTSTGVEAGIRHSF